MTTIHAYTAGQQLVDGPSKSFRRGRAGAANLMPTSTGAARATTRAVSELAGRFDGIAVRAPIPVGSIADIVFVANRPTTAQEVNEAFRQEAASEQYQGILGVSEDPLVSADIVGDPRAAIVGLDLTRVVDATLVKVMARQRMGLHSPDDPRGPQHARRRRSLTSARPSPDGWSRSAGGRYGMLRRHVRHRDDRRGHVSRKAGPARGPGPSGLRRGRLARWYTASANCGRRFRLGIEDAADGVRAVDHTAGVAHPGGGAAAARRCARQSTRRHRCSPRTRPGRGRRPVRRLGRPGRH